MANEIIFTKYIKCGAYHWSDISCHPLKRNSFVIGRYMNMLTLLKNSMRGNLKGKTILDVGCGDGVLSYWIAQSEAEVIGIDYSKEAIDFARKKTGAEKITFVQASAYEIPYDNGHFDAVVSSDVIEHLADPDAYLLEIKRVLKTDGMAIISTPIRFTDKIIDKMHIREMFQSEFQDIININYPGSVFYESHPLFWMEIFTRSELTRLLVTLLSYIFNPFKGLNSKFKHMVLQYSISIKRN